MPERSLVFECRGGGTSERSLPWRCVTAAGISADSGLAQLASAQFGWRRSTGLAGRRTQAVRLG
jgi:hypothetical protein